MDIKEYIASGILESYVLGSASSQERQEVECMSHIYPEIKDELVLVQSQLESYIKTLAVKPPEALKSKILDAIKSVEQDAKETYNQPNADEKKGRVVEMNTTQNSGNANFFKYGMAASIAVILGLAVFTFNQNLKKGELENELASVKSDVDMIKDELTASSKKYQDSIQLIAYRENILLNSETQSVTLAGTGNSPESNVRVFWNKSSSEIVVVKDQLPLAGKDKQFQLWGLVDGVPVDLGMLADNELITNPRKIDLEKVDAFAITLEQYGGSPQPNLEQLYVIGNT